MPVKESWTAEEWAWALLTRLELIDWGMPAIIISDCDPKFLSKFWSAFFKKLEVELFYSIAYHPQTDGSSERTNQIVEIALRFFLHTMTGNRDWPLILPKVQSLFNNASSSTTGQTPNKVAYGFIPRQSLDLLSDLGTPNHNKIRAAALDAIAFVAMAHNQHYDRSHQLFSLKVGEYALLKLHKGYSIPSTIGVTKKLAQQFVGPFKVLEKIGRLTFCLKSPFD